MIIKLIISLLLCSMCFCAEINGRLSIVGQGSNWVEGEIKEVELLIWPLSEINVENAREEIEGKDFCEFFFIGKVKEIGFSKNNPEALKVIADATLKKAFSSNKLIIWSHLALNIPIDTTSFKTIPDEQRIQEFVTLNVDREKNSNYAIYIISVLFLLVTISIYYILKKNRKYNKKIQVNWKERILAASERKEIESLYQNKSDVIEYLGGESPRVLELFQVINKHQYKKEWSEDSLSEITFVLDEIKESLQ